MLALQPIGVFAAPATYLLLPGAHRHGDLIERMLASGAWPDEAPPEWTFARLALEGDAQAAHDAVPPGGDAAYNRFVLAPTEQAYAELKASTDDAERRALLMGVGAVYGYEEAFPPVDELPVGPLAAFLLAARAGRVLRQGQSEQGLADLEAAQEAARGHRALVARMLATRARTLHELAPQAPALVALYQQADQALKATDMARLHGITLLGMGSLYHELSEGRRHLLLEAARAYQRAAQLFTPQTDPERHALALNNLALAYLAVPLVQATDQLRTAIAIQALRDALKVYTRQTHPDEWASTTLNLANALQYAPSGNVEDHLWQAVALYEDILEVRTPEADPGGHARALANQANALAHLGAYSRAVPRLIEARDRFRALGDDDSAATVDATIADIATARELPAADNA